MNTPSPNIEKYIRPSSIGAIALCEGRPLMEAHVVAIDGEPEASQVADMGNDLHKRAQVAVDDMKSGGTWDEVIAFACGNAEDEGIDSWSIYCLRFALETVRDLIAKHGIEVENVLTEQRLDMHSQGFAKGGTADLVLIIPHVLAIVVDFKFGFLDQGDADEHDQIATYGSAAAETYDAAKVIVVLIQPRAEKPHRISQAKFDADDLRRNRAWAASVLNLARRPNPPLTAGFKQCQYCKALPRCAEARKYIMDAKEALEMIGAPLDADGFGALADAAKLADRFAEVGKDAAKAELLADRKVTGWKLGTPRAIRSVADVTRAVSRLEEAGHGAELSECLSISLGKLSPPAADIIADQVTEKLSSPPLTQDKRKGAA